MAGAGGLFAGAAGVGSGGGERFAVGVGGVSVRARGGAGAGVRRRISGGGAMVCDCAAGGIGADVAGVVDAVVLECDGTCGGAADVLAVLPGILIVVLDDGAAGVVVWRSVRAVFER